MKVQAPPLLPLLRSRVQGDLLALLFLNPEQEFSLSEAAGRIGAAVSSVHAEAERLSATGLVVERRLGPVRLIKADTSSVVAPPLTALLTVTFGPAPILGDVLSGIVGVERAYIYGSWAARYNGVAGAVPNDIDVLVIGDADLDDLQEAAERAGERLHREVTVRQVTASQWRRANEGAMSAFLNTVAAGPLVTLDVGEATDAVGARPGDA